MSSLRIAYLDSSSAIGGAEWLLLRLMTGVRPLGVEPLLVCRAGSPLERAATLRGITCIGLKFPRFFSISMIRHEKKILNPFALLANTILIAWSTVKICSVLSKNSVAILQTNTIFDHLSGSLAARVVGIPSIWYFHDLVEEKRLIGAFHLLWRFLTVILPTRVVGVSDAVVRSLGNPDNSVTIYAGIPLDGREQVLDVSLRDRLSLKAEANIVSFVGRIALTKGLDVLVKAVPLIISECPDTYFVVFGGKSEQEGEYYRYVQQLVTKMGVGAHWHWMGYVSQAANWLKEVDVLVVPSRREAFPLVLLEAGLQGIPSVAARVGGIPEIVEDGITGFLIPPEDPQSLASAVIHLLRSRALRESMGKQARERVVRMFGLPQYLESFKVLYQSLLYEA